MLPNARYDDSVAVGRNVNRLHDIAHFKAVGRVRAQQRVFAPQFVYARNPVAVQ